MSIAYPFLDFKLFPVKNVGSTPQIVFASSYPCIISGILLANMVDTAIYVDFYILRDSRPTPGQPTQYEFIKKFLLEPFEAKEVIKSSFNFEAGDILFAYSDFFQNIFNSFISYQELKEII